MMKFLIDAYIYGEQKFNGSKAMSRTMDVVFLSMWVLAVWYFTTSVLSFIGALIAFGFVMKGLVIVTDVIVGIPTVLRIRKTEAELRNRYG